MVRSIEMSLNKGVRSSSQNDTREAEFNPLEVWFALSLNIIYPIDWYCSIIGDRDACIMAEGSVPPLMIVNTGVFLAAS